MMESDGTQRPELLCISTYEKGQAFLEEASRLGCSVTLLTVDKLRDADWPREAIAHLETMPEELAPEAVLPYITRLAKHRDFARIVALDEFDLDTGALAREHLRLPGMGRTATRPFRDKLAMRETAARAGVAVPEFSGVANHDELWAFLQRTQGPWLLKPRESASAIGIHKFSDPNAVWPLLERLGDEASHHLVERFVPGKIFHVEGLSWDGELLFALGHEYGQPPFETMHSGGIFSTRTMERDGSELPALLAIHAATLRGLGMTSGPTHSEFIRADDDGQFYFLETAARVGGAYIAEVVEAASGVNPWVEWARIEVAQIRGERYQLPVMREEYAGSVICLARQEWPETSAFEAPEIVHRLSKHHHAGLILRSPSASRLRELLEDYTRRFATDFYARLDAPAKPTS
ncbi:MAG: ATP-grasp domain-containing protein [Janthinobacterium lividum]